MASNKNTSNIVNNAKPSGRSNNTSNKNNNLEELNDATTNLIQEATSSQLSSSSSILLGGDNSNFYYSIMGGVALMLVLSLSIMQWDIVSRRFLSASRLYTKRRKEKQEYLQKWYQTYIKAAVHRPCSSDIQSGSKQTITTTNNNRNSKNINSLNLQDHAQLLISKTELQDVIKKHCLSDSPDGAAKIIHVGLDEMDPRSLREYWLYLSIPPTSTATATANTTTSSTRLIQVPLVKFCGLLTEHYERQWTSTTFCIVADASGGYASSQLSHILQTTNNYHDIGVVHEPMWLLGLAKCLEAMATSPFDKKQRVVFALCRLAAALLDNNNNKNNSDSDGDEDGINNINKERNRKEKKKSTILLTLPSCTTNTLLPVMHRVFQHDRHVFLYHSCKFTARHLLSNGSKHPTAVCLPTLTIPRTNCFMEALSQLPFFVAAAVETWMTSVDAFLKAKEEEDESSSYVPFVCKWSNIAISTSAAENGKSTTTTTNNDRNSSSLALANLLQYVTGSASRSLSAGFLDAALSTLDGLESAYNKSPPPLLSNSVSKALENVVFTHKGIVIHDTTLVGTVKPRQNWYLQLAQKPMGCSSCCSCFTPQDDEEDEDQFDYDEADGSFVERVSNNPTLQPKLQEKRNGSSSSSSSSSRRYNTNIYVDGRETFAFDPERFAL